MKKCIAILVVAIVMFASCAAYASGGGWFLAGLVAGSAASSNTVQQITPGFDPTVIWIADSSTLTKVVDPLMITSFMSPLLHVEAGHETNITTELVGQDNALFKPGFKPEFIYTSGRTTLRGLYNYLIQDTTRYKLLRVRQVFVPDGYYVRYFFDVYQVQSFQLEPPTAGTFGEINTTYIRE
jgi:hypothetical protein